VRTIVPYQIYTPKTIEGKRDRRKEKGKEKGKGKRKRDVHLSHSIIFLSFPTNKLKGKREERRRNRKIERNIPFFFFSIKFKERKS
jgi:hypothetical protein